MATRSSARFSTYSGAPSLQPSLAPTVDTTADQPRTGARASHGQSHSHSQSQPASYLSPNIVSEKSYYDSIDGSTRGNNDRNIAGNRTNHANSNMAALAPSTSTLASASTSSADPRTQEIRQWGSALERMQDARLDKQRYVMSNNKRDEVSTLSLGAKLERALARRMVGQDAVFTPQSRRASAKPRPAVVHAN